MKAKLPQGRPPRTLGRVTMPDEDNAGSDREARPLGSEVSDPAADGGSDGPADGVAGPSYPPEETEPDAR
jgi:hypothetical protein